MIPLAIPRQESAADTQYKASELDLSTLEAMMPACVLVDERNELVRTYGDCSRVLNVPTGAVTLDIFAMIRTDLKIAVSTVLRECRELQDSMRTWSIFQSSRSRFMIIRPLAQATARSLSCAVTARSRRI